MDVKFYTLSAFSKNNKGGNLAGLVLNGEEYDDRTKKKIASEVGFSETAFLSKSSTADYKIKYFTPTEEVDLCGHATIAAMKYIINNMSPKKSFKLETNVGIIDILINNDVNGNDIIYMEQASPSFFEVIPKHEFFKCFGISDEDIVSNLEPEIVSTGLKDIMLPIKDLDTLFSLTPNFEEITKISKKYNVVGIHAFTFETVYDENTCHARNFAPLYGINEESATGTSNCALASYLIKNVENYKNEVYEYIFEQGYVMENPSEIKIKSHTHENNINKIFVGGESYFIEEKKILL